MMKITQTGIHKQGNEEIQFINSMEGRHYPWFTTMYHPEY